MDNLDDVSKFFNKRLSSKVKNPVNLTYTYMPDDQMWKSFNRFRNSEGIDYLASGVAYVFMVRPELNIVKNENMADMFLATLRKDRRNPVSMNVVNTLDIRNGSTAVTGRFINVITNSAESFECKDDIMEVKEYGDNRMGNKLVQPISHIGSKSVDTFSIEYTEHSDMGITLLHKAWVDYIDGVRVNKIQPYMTDDVDLIYSKVIDYATSLYYFLVGEDGETIKYWAKYTGVFPTSVPYSAMSWKLGDNALRKLSIVYQYAYKEDLDPLIIEEFKFSCNQTFRNMNYCQLKYDYNNNLQQSWMSGVNIITEHGTNKHRLVFKD